MTFFDGWRSPWPLAFGGGPTQVDSAYEALLDSVGTGHAADTDGIEWKWREARAIGLAIGPALVEQALYQFEPATAGAALAYWREVYGVDVGASDQAARDQAALAHHDRGSLDMPTVEARLRAIDPRFEIALVPAELTVDNRPGARAFESWAGSQPFNLWGRRESRLSNYSTAFRLLVTLPVTALGDLERRAIERARRYLDEGVAWCDYALATSAGFVVGQSPIGLTRLVV